MPRQVKLPEWGAAAADVGKEETLAKNTRYVARMPDSSGQVDYSAEDNATWATLFARQTPAVQQAACAEYLHGLDLLQLPADRVPQISEVNRVLQRETGWAVEPVPALIPFERFFALLASRRFPAATFIRSPEELDYLQEPDIFHEIYGHTPMLTHPGFAAFTEHYGKLGLAAAPKERVYLARLYWFTVEFGLVQPRGGPLKIYGGGILSSIGETDYALRDPRPQRWGFELDTVLRTPYRIDIMQPRYFILESLDQLFALTHVDLGAAVASAMERGLLPKPYDEDAPAGSHKSHMAVDA